MSGFHDRQPGAGWALLSAALLLALSVTALAKARSPGPTKGLTERHRLAPGGKLDWDGDGLRNRLERLRVHTDPHRRDTDGDGLSDGREWRVLHTNPRRPQRTAVGQAMPVSPRPVTAAIPSEPAAASGEEAPVTADDESTEWRPPPPDEPPLEISGEVDGGAELLQVAADPDSDGKAFYMRGGDYGDVDLSDVRRDDLVWFIAHPGEVPSFDSIQFGRSENLRIDGFRAATVDVAPGGLGEPNRNLQLANCLLGGSQAARINPVAVVGVGAASEDVLIDRCEIGWTDMNGAEDHGYGVRAVNGEEAPIVRLAIRRSWIHNVSCDAVQLAGNREFTLDRTEISYVAPEPGYGCHADSIQNMGFIGDGARITNNYIHHVGYYEAGTNPGPGDPAGQFIYHNNGGGALIENNLFVDNRNYALNLGSGCDGCPRTLSNVILRRNTIVRDGTAFGGESTPDLRWAPTGGSGNRFERNVIGGIAADGSTSASVVAFSGNVYTDQGPLGPEDAGPLSLSFDASMNCVSAACANAGYRKPGGVSW